jgi:hypothetical protein
MSTFKSISIKQVPLYYPFLFSIYPVLALLGVNTGQVRPEAGLRIGLISLGMTIVVFVILRVILKNSAKTALLTAIIVILFFTYGHVYQLLEQTTILGLTLGRHRVLLPSYIVLFMAALGFVLQRPAPGRKLGNLLNLIAAFLIAMPLIQLGVYALQTAPKTSVTKGEGSGGVSKPDVYYIILDGYNRADTLNDLYGYDNQPFMDDLETLGFITPACAESNFGWTALSMASTFQMSYLEDMDLEAQRTNNNLDWAALENRIRYNPVRDQFKALGYEVVSFGTGFSFTEWTDADQFLTLDETRQRHGMTVFEVLFLRTTLMRVVVEGESVIAANASQTSEQPDRIKYDEVMFTLDQLDKLAGSRGPKFVYAHLVAPHMAYVFDSKGEYKVQEQIPGYTDEITYLNQRMLELFEEIIAQSDTPPIIILQSDHGWDWERRMAILNALYLPEPLAAKITPDWTPVNTFRLIFNDHFGLDYPLLKNVSYFSPEGSPMDFSVVPPTCMDD